MYLRASIGLCEPNVQKKKMQILNNKYVIFHIESYINKDQY